MSSTSQSLVIEHYRGFSCPFEPFQEDLFSCIVQEYSKGITSTFLENLDKSIYTRSKKVIEFIIPWLNGSNIPESGWDQCFGHIFHNLQGNHIGDQDSILTGIAMHLGSLGAKGSWEIKLSNSNKFRWGNILLPPTSYLKVECEGDVSRIEIENNEADLNFILHKKGLKWYCNDLEKMYTVTGHQTYMKLFPKTYLFLPGFEAIVDQTVPSVNFEMVKMCEDALSIINKYTPEYIPWVRRSIKDIFLLIRGDHNIDSGSIESYLGTVHFSAYTDPVPIAELLIHEAAHQHMNILAKLGPVDDGTDHNMYYSPPVDKHRRIHLILAAYHAFANVLIFYRICKDKGLDSKECDRQESLLLPWLDTLEKPLRNNKSLTEIGNALWQPLQQIIR